MDSIAKSLDSALPDTAHTLIVKCVVDGIPFKLPSYLGAREGLLTIEDAHGDIRKAVQKMHKNSHLWRINTSILGAVLHNFNVKLGHERKKKIHEELQKCHCEEQFQWFLTEYQRAFQD